MSQRERIQSVCLLNGQGPAAVPVSILVADNANVGMRAWISNFGSSNVWIFEGGLTLPQCQNRISATGNVDGVCLTGTGPVFWQPAEGAHDFTVFFEAANTSGQTQGITLVVVEGLYR